MRILFVAPYAPNLVRTRSYNLIRHLSRRGNDITLLTLWTNEQERADLERLNKECCHVQALSMPAWKSLWNCLLALPRDVPFQSVFSWRPELIAGFNGNSSFDVIHVEHLRGSRYGLFLKSRTNLPVVWDSVDCITYLFRQAAEYNQRGLADRLRTRVELARTERFERWLLDKFDHVLVTSAVDKKALSALNVNGDVPSPISVLENGVDLTYFKPDDAATREPDTLVVSGKMSYHANVAMARNLVEHIMPYIWAQRPEVKLWIVGKDPTRDVQALSEHPAVTVTGTVDDLRPYLWRATIAVTPVTYGAGIQNKVLEAMACATPVVTTPQAISAINVVPGQDLLVAEKPDCFAQTILDLLDDPGRQGRLGRTGLEYVKTHHHWDDVAARLEAIYREHMSDSSVLV